MTYYSPCNEQGINEVAIWNYSILHPGLWFVNDHADCYYAVVDDFGDLVRCAA